MSLIMIQSILKVITAEVETVPSLPSSTPISVYGNLFFLERVLVDQLFKVR